MGCMKGCPRPFLSAFLTSFPVAFLHMYAWGGGNCTVSLWVVHILPKSLHINIYLYQSADVVRILIFCSVSIFLLASLLAGRRPCVQLLRRRRKWIPPFFSQFTEISNSFQLAQNEGLLGRRSMQIFSLFIAVCVIMIFVEERWLNGRGGEVAQWQRT